MVVENTLRIYGQEIVCFCIEWDLAFKGAVCGFFENVVEKRANDIIPSTTRFSCRLEGIRKANLGLQRGPRLCNLHERILPDVR